MHFLDKNVKTKKAVKNEATLRSDPTQAAEYYGCFSSSGIPKRINLGVWGRAPTAVRLASSGLPVQAAGLSSKKIAS